MLIVAPVILLSPPRSGSTLLFETLARSPELYSLGDESHALIEAMPSLHPAARGYESNRLLAADATPDVVSALHRGFLDAVHDANGAPPPPGTPIRLLEKTPKNSLRVPFLRRVFPDAHFVFLYRDPREVIASMIEAWLSGRFVTYAGLPGWRDDLPWSMLLPPGWRAWRDLPVAEVAARQWQTAMGLLLDDLEGVPVAQRMVVNYQDLVRDPDVVIGELCTRLSLRGNIEMPTRLPAARSTVTAPAPDKWRRRTTEIAGIWPTIRATAQRAANFAGAVPVPDPPPAAQHWAGT